MKKIDTYLDCKGIRRFKKRNKNSHSERAYEIICDECGEKGYIRKQTLDREKHYCSRSCQKKFMSLTGEKHHWWKGGRRTNKDGYIWIMEKKHPRSNRDGYISEHILVIEKELGRFLKKNEIVHHIDINRSNNLLENLLLTDNGNHKKMHQQLSSLLKILIEKEIIIFDKKNKTYNINENIIRE